MILIHRRRPSSIATMAFAVFSIATTIIVVASFTSPIHHNHHHHQQQQQHNIYTPSQQTTQHKRRPPKRRSIKRATAICPSSHSPVEETSATSPTKRTQIVILGGGFGGLNAALALSSLLADRRHHDKNDDSAGPPKITLVDRKERFVFLPLLYELCVGNADLEEVAPTFESLLRGTDVEFVAGDVDGVDVAGRTVYVSSSEHGTSVEYDALVVATGADVDLSAVRGAEERALPFYTVEDCFELRRTLALFDSHASSLSEGKGDGVDGTARATETTIRVVVVGGGYSGVELALNVAERLRRSYSSSTNDIRVDVTLVHRGDAILQYATDYNRQKGIERLDKVGVTCRTGCGVVDVSPLDINADNDDDSVKFRSSPFLENRRCRVSLRRRTDDDESSKVVEDDVIEADLLLWTAGASSINEPKGVLNSILPRDANGRIVTDTFLRIVDTDTGGGESSSSSSSTEAMEERRSDAIFALGDRARVTGRKPYGATAQVAIQQAAVVAWNVYASLASSSDPSPSTTPPTPSLLPFSYLDLGEMLTLGEEDASIDSLNGSFRLDGAGASILRRLIYAARMPTGRQAAIAAVAGLVKRAEGRRSSNAGGAVATTTKTTTTTTGPGKMEKKKFSWK